MGLEKARMAWLDDWRFNEDTIPYSVQLLWFEGAPFVIATPQNHFSGHLRYSKDDPVFITTLQEDLTALQGKRFLKQGDVDMMLKRLKVFTFTKKMHSEGGCTWMRMLLHRFHPPEKGDGVPSSNEGG